MEELQTNLFMFSFSSKEDKDLIFNSRPWNINRAHLILKEWSEDEPLSNLAFKTSTFFIQIHGLPPKRLNEKNTFKIGSMIGELLLFNVKVVVAQYLLRVQLDLMVGELLIVRFK